MRYHTCKPETILTKIMYSIPLSNSQLSSGEKMASYVNTAYDNLIRELFTVFIEINIQITLCEALTMTIMPIIF